MSKPSSPTPSNTPSSPEINKAALKLCHIVKRPDFDGYGFNLHSEKSKPGQFIGKVDANSPAEAAGLKEGDRIIEVNGTAIHSETHKQVVQRIKAISGEVRLLLIDVDGKGDGKQHLVSTTNGHTNNNNNNTTSMEVSKTEQVLPGASENINSITMVSTKRASQTSHSSGHSAVTTNANGSDVTDHQVVHSSSNNNNIPPPPSATMATVQKTANGGSSSPSGNGNGVVGGSTAAPAPSSTTTAKTGGLQLNMTAAEMRAKLLSRKKYDPKNESVDLKKKYEIVQKL
ncbi:Na(+)/H(+) exchange regulatory cofactor NHE-RF1 [Musca vetustissima]|uniref:Na(+)/H(+) exchange regulatory cofactor NHE-RF1 n=1 Tax=Musca vetustissima TaxID=27455 RepID=UPI002AB76BBF|nr:Na(+)/H(+) exchange regulatory cofactor NHE-RF1 [Musca vetustissima]